MFDYTRTLALPGLVLVATACSGGGGDDDDDGGSGTLTSGMYAIESVSGLDDSCGIVYPDLADEAIRLVVNTGGTVSFSPLPGTIYSDVVSGTLAGTSLSSSTVIDLDMSTAPLMGSPFDCVLRATYSLSATVTSDDHAAATEELGLTALSGTQCEDAGNYFVNFVSGAITAALPCTASVDFDLVKTGEIPLPFSGTIDLSGSGAILTVPTNVAPTTGPASMSGTIEGNPATDTGTFACAEPDSANFFNNYTIAFVGADYRIQIDVNPAAWAIATLPLDGTDVNVSVERLADSLGAFVTGGSLSLNSAPTIPDDVMSLCDFSITGMTFTE